MLNYPPGNYKAVGDLCAVDFDAFDLTVNVQQIMDILAAQGFKIKKVDMVEIARKQIGHSAYVQDAISSLAPTIVNCRTIIKWLYGKKGIWLPPRWQGLGRPVNSDGILVGDLISVTDPDSPSGGHVGMATGDYTVIHANQGVNLTEVPFHTFVNGKGISLRNIKRIMLNPRTTITLRCPSRHDVEWSGDIASIVRRELNSRKQK